MENTASSGKRQKRKATEPEESINASSSMGVEPPRKLKKGVSPMKEKQPSSEVTFEELNMRIYRKLVSETNAWFKRQVEALQIPDIDEEPDGPPVLTAFEPASEYLRRMRDISEWSAVDYSGTLVSFGNDDSFVLGRGEISDDGKKDQYPPSAVEAIKKPVLRIAAGGSHSMALTIEGDIYTWGLSDEGQLGRSPETIEEYALQQGVSQQTLQNKKEWEAKQNELREGFDARMELFQSLPDKVDGFISSKGIDETGLMINVAAGASHSLCLSRYGNVYFFGQMQDIDSGKFCSIPENDPNSKCKGKQTRPIQVPVDGPVKSIHAGSGFCVAVLHDWSVVSWGFGNHGELARSKNMGAQLKDDGTYDLSKSFFYKTVKDEDGEDILKPNLEVIQKEFLTPKPVCWASNIYLRSSRPEVAAVACGAYHLLVAARDPGTHRHQLFSSGLNNYGQLGHGDEDQRHALTPVDTLGNENITQVAAGTHHSIALNLVGTKLFSWGRADYGQLGLPHSSGEHASGAFFNKPQCISRPRPGPGERPILWGEIAAGESHSMAWTEEGHFYTWGFGESGATGHPTKEDQDVIQPKLLDLRRHVLGKKCDPKRLVKIRRADGGGQHSLAVVDDRKIKS